MIAYLMMSANLATPGLLKITVIWNKDYDVIISVHDINYKIWAQVVNYVVDVAMWPRSGISSISMKEFIHLSQYI